MRHRSRWEMALSKACVRRSQNDHKGSRTRGRWRLREGQAGVGSGVAGAVRPCGGVPGGVRCCALGAGVGVSSGVVAGAAVGVVVRVWGVGSLASLGVYGGGRSQGMRCKREVGSRFRRRLIRGGLWGARSTVMDRMGPRPDMRAMLIASRVNLSMGKAGGKGVIGVVKFSWWIAMISSPRQAPPRAGGCSGWRQLITA